MNNRFLFLTSLQRYGDYSLLLLRVVVGCFLIWGVLDNITSEKHMKEFEQFLQNFGFIYPAFMARLSVWAQFLVGCLFISGFLTRWAGIVCVINFAVAILMVDNHSGIRASFLSMCLILIGLFLATYGGGQISADNVILRRQR